MSSQTEGPMRRTMPPAVHVSEQFGHDATIDLFPEETAVIAQCTPKRRREFTAVRACARTALAAAGAPIVALVPRKDRAPVWPSGFVGTLTHCDGYCAAAVARAEDTGGVGIDAEPDLSLPVDILSAVATPAERSALKRLPEGGPAWDRILFSAKEAVFKAWYPRTRRWLDFDDGMLIIQPDGTFELTLLGTAARDTRYPWPTTHGRWAVAGGIITTAVTLPRSAN